MDFIFIIRIKQSHVPGKTDEATWNVIKDLFSMARDGFIENLKLILENIISYFLKNVR